MSYLNHSINDSAFIHGQAGIPFAHPAMLAVKYANGKFILPDAGDPAMGIVLANAEDVLLPDAGMDIQIKDICYWIAGGDVAAGSELTPDAAGRAVVAAAGTFILAFALEAGVENQPIKVQVVKAGYKTGGVITPIRLADCSDVNITPAQLADGQTLTYDAATQKWVNEAIPAQTLAGLSDVDIDGDTLADGQVLTYDGTSKFVNEAIPAQSLAGLSDVDIDTGTLADGQVLTFDGTDKFVNEAIPAIGLNDLTDVTLTGPFSDNDVVAYDETAGKFINQAQV